MFKYIFRKTKGLLIKFLKQKVVILNKKSSLSLYLVLWRKEFLVKVEHKITHSMHTILEIGDGDGSLSYNLSKKYKECFFYGIDLGIESFKEKNYYHHAMSATDILFQDNFFDLIISHNVFEHIHDLKKGVNEMIRVLKPSGKIYTFFAPIWTSSYGHHFYDDTGKEVSSIFPPYAHLYMNNKKIKKLISKKLGLFSSDSAMAKDYLLGDCCNKMFPEDYRKLFLGRHDLKILEFKEIIIHHHNDNISIPKKLLEKYKDTDMSEFKIVGFEIEGIKI